MKATKNCYGISRILVLIKGDSRAAKMNHEFTRADGTTGSIITKLPMYEEVDKYELNVSIGEVVGLGDGVEDIQVGDIAIIDYIVDSDDSYQVAKENGDKIVTVPCQTRLHDKDIVVTSYGSKVQDKKTGSHAWVRGAEKNIKVARAGAVDQVSLLLGIIRDGVLYPHPSYLFCEPEPDKSAVMIEKNGILAYRPDDRRLLKRTVKFADPESGFAPGDVIYAAMDSNFLVQFPGAHFDLIAVHEVFAMEDMSMVEKEGLENTAE